MLMGMDIPNMPIEYRQTGIRRVCPPPSRNTPPTLAGGVTVAKRRAPPGTTRRGPAVVGLGHGVRHRTPDHRQGRRPGRRLPLELRPGGRGTGCRRVRREPPRRRRGGPRRGPARRRREARGLVPHRPAPRDRHRGGGVPGGAPRTGDILDPLTSGSLLLYFVYTVARLAA